MVVRYLYPMIHYKLLHEVADRLIDTSLSKHTPLPHPPSLIIGQGGWRSTLTSARRTWDLSQPVFY